MVYQTIVHALTVKSIDFGLYTCVEENLARCIACLTVHDIVGRSEFIFEESVYESL